MGYSKTIDIGYMRKRIQIERRKEVPDDSVGTSWIPTPLCTVWAQLDEMTGNQFYKGVPIQEGTTHVMVCRYNASITADQTYARYNGRLFRIRSRQDIDQMMHRYLLLELEEIPA